MDAKVTIPAIAGVISAIAAVYCYTIANNYAENISFHVHENAMYSLSTAVFAVIAIVCLILAAYFANRRSKK